MAASVGLIALWTGELTTNIEHMKYMAIHAMSEEKLDLFAKYVRQAKSSIENIEKYVKEQREAA